MLPLDLARHVLALPSPPVEQLQAASRGVLARSWRPPLERGGLRVVEQAANGACVSPWA